MTHNENGFHTHTLKRDSFKSMDSILVLVLDTYTTNYYNFRTIVNCLTIHHSHWSKTSHKRRWRHDVSVSVMKVPECFHWSLGSFHVTLTTLEVWEGAATTHFFIRMDNKCSEAQYFLFTGKCARIILEIFFITHSRSLVYLPWLLHHHPDRRILIGNSLF